MKTLIAVDGSECSDVAIEKVAKRPWPADSAVRIISVAETLPLEVLSLPRATAKTLRERRGIGLHSIEQRLACWLLMTYDRVGSEKLQVAQEFFSNLLGARREGVSLTIGSLRNKGVIVCKRGFITILDRARLEAEACECYRVIKDEYDRLLD